MPRSHGFAARPLFVSGGGSNTMPGFETGRDLSRGPGETANADVHLPFLHRLPPPLRRALERVGNDQKFAAGADLMRAGHATNWIGVITRGVVRVCGHDVA